MVCTMYLKCRSRCSQDWVFVSQCILTERHSQERVELHAALQYYVVQVDTPYYEKTQKRHQTH